jgi:hypothetical protein
MTDLNLVARKLSAVAEALKITAKAARRVTSPAGGLTVALQAIEKKTGVPVEALDELANLMIAGTSTREWTKDAVKNWHGATPESCQEAMPLVKKAVSKFLAVGKKRP